MNWSIQVLLNGADITAQLLTAPVVEVGESQSALADIQFHPAAVEDFRGQTLFIAINTGAGLQTIHSGAITKSESDLITGDYTLQSSNELQEYFRNLADEDAVLAALPGAVYSDAIFGESEDRWKWAQDALSTIPAECHLTTDDALEVVNWAAKATPDHVLTGADIHNVDAHAYEERGADDQSNRVVIEYGYGYTRWKSREHSYSYDLSHNNPSNQQTWCDWYTSGGEDFFQLPLVDTIRSAVSGSGWAVSYEAYKGHPETANCNGNSWDIGTEQSIEQGRVTNATIRLFKNYSQPIGEDYTITVESSASIARYGTVTRNRAAGRDIEADNETFTDDSGFQSSWTTDNIGDRYQDQDDETIRLSDIQCALQAAHVQIWERHRNSLTVVTDINPTITLADTIELQNIVLRAGTLNAKGKVTAVKYNLEAATPRMTLTLAITRGAAGTADTLTPPPRPDTDQSHTGPDDSTVLNNHIGYRLDSPDYNTDGGDDWTGWLTNSAGIFIPPTAPTEGQIYPEEFRIATIGVEDEAANELAVTATATYNVAIPDDIFTIT